LLGAASPVRPATRIPRPGRGIYRNFAKRLIDIALVLIAALPVLAVVLPIAMIIAMDRRNPFYLQDRVGQNGRVFRMVKLRSMVWDADRVLADHLSANPAARAEWDKYQKLRNDPRITPLGQLIRKSSLDELPQVWNVLMGHMSIVGPRPMMCNQRVLYPGTEYYAMRPGITGFWQISIRHESSFRDRAQFDRSYFAQLSFLTDVRVIARTFGVVLRGTGV
jgi:lipopolysaccharide/colanic/teichoic acid biosynthesis glycosyltransferase